MHDYVSAAEKFRFRDGFSEESYSPPGQEREKKLVTRVAALPPIVVTAILPTILSAMLGLFQGILRLALLAPGEQRYFRQT
jgi:hypothetical protein